MRKIMLIPCLALIAAAAPASPNRPPVAQQVAPSIDQQAVAPPVGGGVPRTALQSEDKKICKQLPTTASRLPNRACLTAKEWKQVEDDLSH